MCDMVEGLLTLLIYTSIELKLGKPKLRNKFEYVQIFSNCHVNNEEK